MLRRPIKALNHRAGGKKQVCLDCNGAVASPAFTSNDPACFASFDLAKQTLRKTRTLSSYSTSSVQVFFILEERAIFFNPLVGEN